MSMGIIPIPLLIGGAIAAGAGLYLGLGPLFGGSENEIPEPSRPPAPPAPQTREELTQPSVWADVLPERTVAAWQAHEWVPELPGEPDASGGILAAALVLAAISGFLVLRG